MSVDTTYLDLNSTQYVAGAQAAQQATSQLTGAMNALHGQTGQVGRALDLLTPRRQILGSPAAAMAWQKELSGLRSTATITGQSIGGLTAQVNWLARALPVGQQGALAMVQLVTQLGLGADTSVRKIGELARNFVQLQQATGEGGLTTGLVQLERTFGDQGVDPRRVRATSDVLVTLSKNAGASASSILDFSNAIGPMTAAAGIGKTTTLGISAAFARTGQDGTAAANAVSTMLTQMSRSVRDGSADLNVYAQAVGSTREQFEALFKARPAEALSQVLGVVATGTPQSQRFLETIGLDSFRSMRAIQAVAQSGGLRDVVGQATGAYGNDATARAASAAGNNVIDTFTKASSAAQQLGEAFGEPILGPLNLFGKGLGALTGLVGSILSSRPGQLALDVVGYGGAALGGLLALNKVGAVGGAAVRMARSSPVSSGLAGYQVGRLGEAGALSALGPGGAMAGTLAAQGLMMPTGFIGRNLSAKTFDFGIGMGQAAATRDAVMAARMGMSVEDYQAAFTAKQAARSAVGKAAGRVATGASLLAEGYLGQVVWGARGAWQNPSERELTDPTRPGTGNWWQRRLGLGTGKLAGYGEDVKQEVSGFYQAVKAGGATQADVTKAVAGLSDAAKKAVAELEGLGPSAKRLVGSFANATLASGGFVGRTAGAGVATFGKGLLNPWLLGIGGAIAGYSIYSGEQSKISKAQEFESTPQHTLDSYREATGRATSSTLSLADALTSAAGRVDALFGGAAGGSASVVSPADIAASRTGAQIHPFVGGNDTALQQLIAMSPTELTGADLQAVKVDLLRQGKSSTDVNTILANYHQAFTGGGKPGIGALQGLATAGGARPGSNWSGAATGKTQQQTIADIGDALEAQYQADAAKFGPDYANQQLLLNSQKILGSAVTSVSASGGSQRYVEDLRNRINQIAGGQPIGQEALKRTLGQPNIRNQIGGVGVTDFSRYTGPTSEGQKPLDLGPNTGRILDTGHLLPAIAQVSALQQLPWTAAAMSRTGGQFAAGAGLAQIVAPFPGSQTGAAGSAYARFAAEQGNTLYLDRAVDTTIEALHRQGRSYDQIAAAGAGLVSAFDNTSQAASQFGAAVRARAGQELQVYGRGTMIEGLRSQGSSAIAGLGDTGIGEAGAANREAGRGQAVDTVNTVRGQLTNYLSAYREFGVQRARTMQDFGIQASYQEADYVKTIGRQERDFQRSTVRAEEDFHITRLRAQRDFGIQMTRLVEDTAKNMYDPYRRLQTEAVWDAGQLVGNLREQNAALAAQQANLTKVRRMGLSGAAIEGLGLTDAAHAQQLAKLTSDFGTDPREVGALNAAWGQRQAAAGALVFDPNNTAVRRAKEDFTRSLSDQQADFSKQVGRAREDFRISLADAAVDESITLGRMESQVGLSLSRMQEDFTRAQTAIAGDMGQLFAAAEKAMRGETVDFGPITDSWLDQLLAQGPALIKKIQEAFKKSGTVDTLIGSLISSAGEWLFGPGSILGFVGKFWGGGQGGPTGPLPKDLRATTGVKGDQLPFIGNYPVTQPYGRNGHPGEDFGLPEGTGVYAALPGVVDWAGLDSSGYGDNVRINSGGFYEIYGHLSRALVNPRQRVVPGQLIGLSGHTGHVSPAGPAGAHLHYEVRLGGVNGPSISPESTMPMLGAKDWYSQGGVFGSPQVIGVGEAGREAVIPLDQRGVGVLSEAFGKAMAAGVSRADTASHVTVIYHQEHIVYDHSTPVTGAVTVVSDDPVEMGHKLAAKARLVALAPRTPVRSPS